MITPARPPATAEGLKRLDHRIKEYEPAFRSYLQARARPFGHFSPRRPQRSRGLCSETEHACADGKCVFTLYWGRSLTRRSLWCWSET